MRAMLARVSTVTPAVCGLTSTLSNASSGWSDGGGSFDHTSSPAPAILLSLSGAARRDLLLGQIGIAGEHAHAEEAARELRDAAADIAEADDAECLARHVVA